MLLRRSPPQPVSIASRLSPFSSAGCAPLSGAAHDRLDEFPVRRGGRREKVQIASVRGLKYVAGVQGGPAPQVRPRRRCEGGPAAGPLRRGDFGPQRGGRGG